MFSFFSNLSIFQKVFAGFLVTGILAVFMALLGVLNLNHINNITGTLSPHIKQISYLREISDELDIVNNDLDRYLTVGGDENREIIYGDLRAIKKTIDILSADIDKEFNKEIDRYLLANKTVLEDLSKNISELVALKKEPKPEGLNEKIVGIYALLGDFRANHEEMNLELEDHFRESLSEQRDSIIIAIKQSIAIIMVISLLGFLLSFLLSNSITKPVLKLRDTTDAIMRGDYGARAEVQSGDEIGQLAAAFNGMADNLNKYTAGLEDEVKNRTKELDEKVTDLGESKKAILNLLEDIEKEKGEVEQKVDERTRELKEEKARLLASINSLSLGFVIADMEHLVILKNKAMAELFELKESDEISIDQISKMLGGSFNVKTESEKCLRGGKTCEVKEILFGKRFLRGMISPVLLVNYELKISETIGYVLLLEDITEAKVVERSRDEFFAVASHELRTPLTAIRGNSEMIQDIYRDKIVDKDMAEMVSDIHEASVRLIGIVNDFLDTSRLEQGKTTFKKEAIDLLPILRETCKEIKPLAEAKNLLLTFTEPAEKIPLVLADSVRIKQAISNFIDNAVKYTEKGSVTVSVEREGNSVAVSVSDTGKGISPGNQSLLFRKFQQAGEEMLSRDVSKSTGLGLYITKLVVEGMGGTVSLVKSGLGEGSTFRLTMPIAL